MRSRALDGTRCEVGQSELEAFRDRVTLRPWSSGIVVMPAAPASFRVQAASSGARGRLALRIQQERKLVARDPELLPSRQRRAGGAHAVALVITRRTGITAKGRWRKPWRSQYVRGARMWRAQLRSRSTLHHRVSWPKTATFRDSFEESALHRRRWWQWPRESAQHERQLCFMGDPGDQIASAKLNPWPSHRNATSGPS